MRNLTGTKYEKEFPAYERVLNLSIPDLSKDEIVPDGYVVHSLEAALWSFLKHDNYRDIVLEAVNLGGDTDTIGLIELEQWQACAIIRKDFQKNG
ncbi:ADP-ribosylglycohydrolase family protein [Priestia koreensis]|uniref:ADP-ribosylglycohydrolase family protein n=1 Tax=Priestia koreensis TaxID=284581 RepID=UPI0030192BC6